jgi:iron-sulfur cluster assembly protein
MGGLVQLGSAKRGAAAEIRVSERAREELGRLGAGGGRLLRIAVTEGGCAGYTYAASLVEAARDTDAVVYDSGELRIIADREQLGLLAGLRIDYSDDLVASGFRLTNSNAGRACGCGASFSG